MLRAIMTLGCAVVIASATMTAYAQGDGRGEPRQQERRDRDDRPPRGGGGRLMRMLDTDRDGVLSKDEIEKASEALKELDANGDGKVSQEEISGRRGDPRRGDRDRDNRAANREERDDQRREAASASPRESGSRNEVRRGGPQKYSIEQAMSDNAQLHTIAFSGLAFITGDYGACTFIPPGKVCDFFGFQYMRDIDAAQKGHNPIFLNRVAGNVLGTLNDKQRALFESSARREAKQLRALAEMRLPLIRAFWRELQGERPEGSQGLNRESVVNYVGDIFAFDAEVSYRRAQVFAQVAASFTPEQKAYFAKMKFGDFNTWPAVDAENHKLPRGTEKLVNVAYMTHASEFFSWYAGSVEADVYFCPERHGTYFGGFYMKDMPAMGKRDYDISTSVTGDSGRAFIERVLTTDQRKHVTAIPDLQRDDLAEVVKVRRAISVELRKFLADSTPDKEKLLALGRRYGELDGAMSYEYATAFAKVNKTLTAEQRQALMKLRNLEGYTSAPAYIYSTAVRQAPVLPDTDRFFFPPHK